MARRARPGIYEHHPSPSLHESVFLDSGFAD
jgi:hypothetical protein